MTSANLSNWRSKPYSAWAFHHVEELLPCATIANAPDAVVPLEAAPHALGDSILQTFFLRATATDALVILHDGRIAYEYYANGNDAHTPHILMSVTKSVVGFLAAMLAERGAVDLAAPVERYVPEARASAFSGAALRELLDMRAGVVLDAAQEHAYTIATGWEPAGDKPAPELHAFLAAVAGPAPQHGGPFRYISANTDLVGWALERATGTAFATLVSDLLWKPLGAEHAASLTLARGGAPRTAGGMCATARDLARLGQLVCDDGAIGGRAVVPPQILADIRSAGDGAAWRDGEWGKAFAAISRNMRYRSGWYVIADEPEIIFAMGIHGQNLFIDRRNRIVIAKLSSWAQSTDYVALPMTHAALGHVRRALTKA